MEHVFILGLFTDVVGCSDCNNSELLKGSE